MAQMQGEIKRNIASLFGGVVIAAIVFVLWMLVTGELGYAGMPVVIVGAAVAAASGAYVRLADL
jgi:hypothetical protein